MALMITLYLQAALNLSLLAWLVWERHQRRMAERRLVQLRRRTGTPTERETELVLELDALGRRNVTLNARLAMVEAERDRAVESEQAMRASLHDRVQARREEREASCSASRPTSMRSS